VQATRTKDPAFDLHELPNVDIVLLSHYHEDHFDQKVEQSLRRDLPIITTPHARKCLVDDKKEDQFTAVTELDFWDECLVDVEGGDLGEGGKGRPKIKVRGMPGKHVPPGPIDAVNEILKAVPPVNGWMVELGYGVEESFSSMYRIYISGDTLLIDELAQIPEQYKGQNIDLMLVHLGGTTIPGPNMPLLMVTMDASQGVQLIKLIRPDLTIPVHFDDYDVFLSSLEDFKKAVQEAGLSEKVMYLDRNDEFAFRVG